MPKYIHMAAYSALVVLLLAAPRMKMVATAPAWGSSVADSFGKNIASGGTFKLPYKTRDKIAEIIFAETRMPVERARLLGIKGLAGKSSSDTVRVRYPKIVMLGDSATKYEGGIKSIRFLDESGKTTSEVKLVGVSPSRGWSKVRVSGNGRYVAVNNIHDYGEKGEGRVDADLSVLDDEGHELWRMKHHLTDAIPSTDGKLVVGVPDEEWGEAPISVYREGRLIGRIPKDDQAWDVAFSEDGTWFAVTVVRIERGSKVESYGDICRADLIAFDSEGNELWRKDGIARGDASFSCPIRIADDDTLTVMTGVGEYYVYQFDKQGRLTSETKGDLETLRHFRERRDFIGKGGSER